jgi:hypothetical protein
MPVYQLPDGSWMHDDANEAAITELFAYLSTDETGEGICAGFLDGVATPLVTSKRRIADGPMRAMARQIEQGSGKPVRLVRFVRVEEEQP